MKNRGPYVVMLSWYLEELFGGCLGFGKIFSGGIIFMGEMFGENCPGSNIQGFDGILGIVLEGVYDPVQEYKCACCHYISGHPG